MNTKSYIITFLFFAASSIAAFAQKPENILPAAGTPPNPKVQISWNRYHDATALEEIYRKMVSAHPDLVTLESVGKSFQGRDMWMLTITDKKTALDHSKKPAMYIDAAIHANEIQTTEFALYIAWYVTEMHAAGNAYFKELLADKTFYIAPSINPDSRDHFIHTANTQNSSRTGQVPIDNDRDGLVNEDDVDDLNGDGHITQMRRKSPYGQFVADPNDPRRLIRVQPGQQGEYELLGSEGIDNDGDGLVNEDGVGQYDPNRDWGWSWEPNYMQSGAYKYPFSLPENRAIADFIISHPNIAAGQNFHNMGGYVLRGPGSASDEQYYGRDDNMVYDALGKKGEEIIPFYRYIITYKDMYNVYGGQLDWMFAGRGIFVFCNELWTNKLMYNRDPEPVDRSQWGSGSAEQYKFEEHYLFGDAFVDWEPYNHPQYGEIEIGGFKKNYGRLHPGFLLESDAHRNAAFVIYHAHATPKLSVPEIKVKELGGGLKEVTAIVKNERLIPTHSGHDVRNKIEVPDIVSLKGGTVVAGMLVDNVDFGLTTEQKNDPTNLRVPTIPGHGLVTVRWIVKGGSSYTVTVDSKKGGIVSKTI